MFTAMLPANTIDDLRTRARQAIRGGYEEPKAVIDSLVELIEYDPETEKLFASDRAGAVAEITAVVSAEDSRYFSEVGSWPPETDCDRLAAVFTSLDSGGIVARENIGYTRSDLQDEMSELVANLLKAGRGVRGWVGFHGQDVERAIDGGGLYLGFAPARDSSEAAWLDVGNAIVDAFKSAGFKVAWNGTSSERPHLAPVDWKRRRQP